MPSRELDLERGERLAAIGGARGLSRLDRSADLLEPGVEGARERGVVGWPGRLCDQQTPATVFADVAAPGDAGAEPGRGRSERVADDLGEADRIVADHVGHL